jgi:predicted metal-dependent phosphoesterase TrpH
MGLADLHIHTDHSHDGVTRVPAVLKRAAEIGLDVVAIADHDQFDGALEALELAAGYGVGVVPGCEISTADGHLVALFIRSRIPQWLTLAETLRRVADQGGLCFAAHPGGGYDYSLSTELIRRTLQDPALARVLVGIETFNAGLLHPADNLGAQILARELPVARLGGSDAHILRSIGTGLTWFPGTSVDDLREALECHYTEAVAGRIRPRAMVLAEWGTRLALRYGGPGSGGALPAGRADVTPPPSSPGGALQPPTGDD